MSSGQAASSASLPPNHLVETSTSSQSSPLSVDSPSAATSYGQQSGYLPSEDPVMEISGQDDEPTSARSASHGIEGAANGQQETSNRSASGGFLLQPLRPVFDRRRSKRASKIPKPQRKSQSALLPAEHSSPHIRGHTPELNQDGAADSSSTPTNGAVDAIRVDKQRRVKGKGRVSGSPPVSQSSSTAAGSSRSARPLDEDGITEQLPAEERPQQSTVDPSAIVRMALSLNESRRLNLSPGRLASNPSPMGRRSTSGRLSVSPAALQGHFGDHREELRRSLQPQGTPPGSRGSPSLDASGGQHSRPGSSSWAVPQTNGLVPVNSFDQDAEYTFSDATIARAEKARRFIELHHEYRRLLEVLPPLSPASTGSYGQAPKLGRPYNPLQYIRNRKIRGRERGLLDPEGAGWNQPVEVKAWVDSTTSEAKLPGYTSGDVARLPPWNRRGQTMSESTPESMPVEVPGPATSGSKPKRPKLEWTFAPSDLLADAYWLEQDTHKTLIETRHGDRLFTRFQRPENLDPPEESRLSYESKTDNRENEYPAPFPELNRSPSSPPDQINSPDGSLYQAAYPMAQGESNISRVKRRLLPRRRTTSATASLSSGSDDGIDLAHQGGKTSLGRKLGINIGPLEKHINSMLQLETPNNDAYESQQAEKPSQKDGPQRRGGVSREYQNQPDSAGQADGTVSKSRDFRSLRSSLSTEPPGTPRISIDDVDGARTRTNGFAISPNEGLSPDSPARSRSNTKSRSRPLHFLHRRGKSKQQNNIDENDFAMRVKDSPDDVQSKSPSSPRVSLDSSSRWNSHRPSLSEQLSRTESRSKSQENMASEDRPTSRFFKGGRIGEIVRSERPRVPGFVKRKDSPRKDSTSSSKKGAATTESDSDPDEGIFLSADSGGPRRSQSATDLSRASKYRVKNLPTFRSTNAPPLPENKQLSTNPYDDHIYRQMQEQRDEKRKRKSRYDKLNPASLDTSTDVSPNTSAYDLTKLNTTTDSVRTGQSDLQSASRSSSGVRAADERLNKILREPGGVGTGGLPRTGLSNIDTKPSKSSRLSEYQSAWNASEGATGPESGVDKTVTTTKDINHVRSLLLSSGVKAHAIVRRSNEIRDPASEYLVRAAKTANTTITPVSRRSEHVLAARILSNNLETASSAFQKAADDFRNDTCHRLHTRIDDLRERVNSDLTPHVSTCGDDADAFIARLTTSHTLAVKQVNDSVDLMMRSRWRRVRWLRRTGFTMLEWALVALMWWIWLFVFVFKVVRGLVVGAVRGGRWLLWL